MSGYCFEGTAMLVVGDWGYIFFLAAADRESGYHPTYPAFLGVDSYHSGDDPACLRCMEPIQNNHGGPLVLLRAASYHLCCLGRCLQLP